MNGRGGGEGGLLAYSAAPAPKMAAHGDGSWQLTVFVTDLQVERNLRVRGDTHIGGVMIQLVDSLGRSTEYFTAQAKTIIDV